MISLTTALTLLAHIAAFSFILFRHPAPRPGRRWLFGLMFAAVAASTLYLLPEAIRGAWMAVFLIGTLGIFGGLVLNDMAPNRYANLTKGWYALHVGWGALLLLATLISPQSPFGQTDWLLTALPAPDLPTLIALIGLAASGITLLITCFYLFYQAVLPEIANRALFWVVHSTLLITGIVLLSGGNETLASVGLIALVLVVWGATYAYINHRVFDIRGGLNRSLTLTFLMLFSAGVLFGALYLVTGLNLKEKPEGLALVAALALAIAALYVPVRQLLEYLFSRLLNHPPIDAAQATRGFSQQVAQAVELDELAQAASLSINRMMSVRRSGLMLVNGTYDNEMELIMIPGGSFGPDTKGKTIALPTNSRFYQTLARDHRAVSQFDLEFSPEYADLNDKTLHFFKQLNMSAYAPIVMDHVMMGLLVAGPKQNDSAYFPSDLELLTTFAQQTGFALRSARLVADLQHLNASMRSLNGGLEDANKELARLDSVKTDFVTIASHELRTPLAQIRGYTDIVDALNEQGMLDQDQTNILVANLRKATERMEELITAMLDVSQLDVNAMDLRFAQTTTDTILRMAIEPLTDSIKQRKQSLMVRGVKGLPPVQADLQRLVQAFRNIILNAIKFTPDGGKIDITASLQPAQGKEGIDHVLVTISDTGVGIDPMHIELIFKKFYRTYDPQLHSTGTYKFLGAGPGLGLTIAKGMIESHGGRVWAESSGHDIEEPPGSTFYVLLPTIPPQNARRAVTFETNPNKMSLE